MNLPPTNSAPPANFLSRFVIPRSRYAFALHATADPRVTLALNCGSCCDPNPNPNPNPNPKNPSPPPHPHPNPNPNQELLGARKNAKRLLKEEKDPFRKV